MLWQSNTPLNPQPNEGTQLPATFGDTFNESWRDGLLFSSGITQNNARAAALDNYVDEVRQTSGQDIGGAVGSDLQLPQLRLDAARTAVSKLKQDRPGLQIPDLTDDELDRRAASIAGLSHEAFSEMSAREKTFGGKVGMFAGGLLAGAGDPLNLIFAPVPEAKLGIVATAALWAGLGTESAAINELANAQFRERAAPGYIASGEPRANIAYAAAGGAVLGGLFKGVGAVWSRMKTGEWPRSVRDAGNIVESEANIQASNVLPGVDGAAAHREALSKAVDDIVAGKPVEVPERVGALMAESARIAEPPPLLPTEAKPNVVSPYETPQRSALAALDPRTINVDPERFQFKSGAGAAGVTERLQGVQQWDSRLAGTALVWRDEAGQNWIADGHQRLGLANRLIEQGQQGIKLNAFVLDAKEGVTDSDARVIAAAKNIAEGSGSPIDAAKIMREASASGVELPPLPPRSALVRDGEALARLSPDAFGMAVNEVVPTNQAALVGRLVADPREQFEAMRLLAKAAPENIRQAEMIIRDMLSSGTEQMTVQGGLFGPESFASSIVLERAKIADEALKQIKRDKSTFATLVAESERIQGAGANVLDIEANRARLTSDEQANQFLSNLATRKGPISDALSRIARRLKSGDIKAAAAGREFAEIVREAIAGGLDQGADFGGALPSPARELISSRAVADQLTPAAMQQTLADPGHATGLMADLERIRDTGTKPQMVAIGTDAADEPQYQLLDAAIQEAKDYENAASQIESCINPPIEEP